MAMAMNGGTRCLDNERRGSRVMQHTHEWRVLSRFVIAERKTYHRARQRVTRSRTANALMVSVLAKWHAGGGALVRDLP